MPLQNSKCDVSFYSAKRYNCCFLKWRRAYQLFIQIIVRRHAYVQALGKRNRHYYRSLFWWNMHLRVHNSDHVPSQSCKNYIVKSFQKSVSNLIIACHATTKFVESLHLGAFSFIRLQRCAADHSIEEKWKKHFIISVSNLHIRERPY